MNVQSIDSDRYGKTFGALLAEQRLMSLGPGKRVEAVFPVLNSLTIEQAFLPWVVEDSDFASACLAGIWLYFDYLEQSHTISQQIQGATGSYWHSIMHRREPDSWNSKYWLDRTGRHPIFPKLREFASSVVEGLALPNEAVFLVEQQEWEPYRFVDLCEASRTGKVDMETHCRRIQLFEWRLLFDYCFWQAVGK